MESKTGKLVISSVPTKRAGEQMLMYLQNLMKKVPMEQIEKKVQTLPVTLANNISEENGRKIASDLIQMGVIACYIDPFAPKPVSEIRISEKEDKKDFFGKSLLMMLKNYRNKTQ